MGGVTECELWECSNPSGLDYTEETAEEQLSSPEALLGMSEVFSQVLLLLCGFVYSHRFSKVTDQQTRTLNVCCFVDARSHLSHSLVLFLPSPSLPVAMETLSVLLILSLSSPKDQQGPSGAAGGGDALWELMHPGVVSRCLLGSGCSLKPAILVYCYVLLLSLMFFCKLQQ